MGSAGAVEKIRRGESFRRHQPVRDFFERTDSELARVIYRFTGPPADFGSRSLRDGSAGQRPGPSNSEDGLVCWLPKLRAVAG